MIDISLIIPTYNRARSLERTIRSALELDYPADRFEIIVVDHACKDDTQEVVARIQSVVGEQRAASRKKPMIMSAGAKTLGEADALFICSARRSRGSRVVSTSRE